ncbi:hypothetical protein GCM10027056_17480 [Glaciibacter psychrotolerans]
MGTQTQRGYGGLRIQPFKHSHPQLDIGALQGTHPPLVGVAQARQVPILHPDDVGVRQREIDMKAHQPTERGRRIRRAVYDGPTAGEEPLTRPHEQRGEEGLFATEMPVDGGAAHPGRGTEVVNAHAVESGPGKENRRGREQSLAPIGFRPTAQGYGDGIGVWHAAPPLDIWDQTG